MRVFTISLALLACVTSARSQYFSAGWSPGDPTTDTRSSPQPEQIFTPVSETLSGDPLQDFFTSGPLARLFAKLGYNLTEKFEAAVKQEAERWDPRIPLITDENYGDIIVNETLTPKEEEDRVWFLIVTISSSARQAITHIIDKAFDEAYNKTVVENDLPNVRWGRIDYMNVTYITTKWGLWNAPYIVLLKDKGRTLRFWPATQLRPEPELMRSFLKVEDWKEYPPWSSEYSPGGSREWLMHYLALSLRVFHNQYIRIPKVVVWLITGGSASFIFKLLHKPAKPKRGAASRQQKNPAVSAPEAPSVPAPTSKPKREGAKQRKGGKG